MDLDDNDSRVENSREEHLENFVKKPIVIIKLISIVCSIIVFAGISSQGWTYHQDKKIEICIINESYSTCQIATTVGILAFVIALCNFLWRVIYGWGAIFDKLACILVGEFYLEQLPSDDNRKQFVMADLVFSAFFSFMFLVSFSTMCSQWGKSQEPRGHYGKDNVQAAIAFSFFSVLSWALSSLMAFRRIQGHFDINAEEGLLSGSQNQSSNGFGAVNHNSGNGGGYQDIGGYVGDAEAQFRHQQVQSPFSQQSVDPGYQQMKY